MNKEDYYRLHLIYYFVILFIGIGFIITGINYPIYNELTGEVIGKGWKPFIVFGVIQIVLSFIGMVFFCENKE